MVRHLEYDPPGDPEVSDKDNRPSDNQNNPPNNKLPHGVAPETYEILLYARGHKEILDIVDSLDKGKRIINPTRNLIGVYFGTDVSLRELQKYVGGNRTTNAKRMLKGLETIWQNFPTEIPKEKAVRLKDSPSDSPRIRKERSKAATALWQERKYREKTLQGMKTKGNNQDYIRKLKATRNRDARPQETTEKIRKNVQKAWDRKHNIQENADRKAILARSWLEMTLLLGHSPSSTEVRALKKENKTSFSITMYIQEFGNGSFTRAKENLDRLTTLAGPIFEAAQRFMVGLKSNYKKLSRYGISEEDIQKHNAQIKEACFKILSGTSGEEINQRVEKLGLLLSRIQRRISILTPFSFDVNAGDHRERIIFNPTNT